MTDLSSTPAPDPATITTDLLCFGCRYNLRMQPVDGACPECGLAVAQTVYLRGQERRAFVMDGLPWWVRACYVVFGWVLPLMSFLLVHPSYEFVEWQRGEWYDYVGMLMGGPAALPFAPLLIFASVCLFLLVVNPSRFGRSNVVAIGLGAGLVLGLQYSFIALPALLAMHNGNYDGADSFAFGGFMLTAGFVVANGLRMLVAHKCPADTHPHHFKTLEIFSAIGAVIVCGVSVVLFPLGMMFSSVMYGLAFGSALTRFFLTRHFDKVDARERPAQRGALWTAIGSIAAYLGAWPSAVMLALHEYHKLPTKPPTDCYVCTAAAMGHPWLVRATPVTLSDGRVVRVNRQMRVLKAGEWVLAERLPRLHTLLRGVYDIVGPRLAARVRSPWAADVAWLAFAGPAAVVGVLLRIGGCGARVRAAYRSRASS